MLEKLYKKLYDNGSYTKSFEEFKKQFSGHDKRQKLYVKLAEEGHYKGDYKSFSTKFWGDEKVAIEPKVDPHKLELEDFGRFEWTDEALRVVDPQRRPGYKPQEVGEKTAVVGVGDDGEPIEATEKTIKYADNLRQGLYDPTSRDGRMDLQTAVNMVASGDVDESWKRHIDWSKDVYNKKVKEDKSRQSEINDALDGVYYDAEGFSYNSLPLNLTPGAEGFSNNDLQKLQSLGLEGIDKFTGFGGFDYDKQIEDLEKELGLAPDLNRKSLDGVIDNAGGDQRTAMLDVLYKARNEDRTNKIKKALRETEVGQQIYSAYSKLKEIKSTENRESNQLEEINNLKDPSGKPLNLTDEEVFEILKRNTSKRTIGTADQVGILKVGGENFGKLNALQNIGKELSHKREEKIQKDFLKFLGENGGDEAKAYADAIKLNPRSPEQVQAERNERDLLRELLDDHQVQLLKDSDGKWIDPVKIKASAELRKKYQEKVDEIEKYSFSDPNEMIEGINNLENELVFLIGELNNKGYENVLDEATWVQKFAEWDHHNSERLPDWLSWLKSDKEYQEGALFKDFEKFNEVIKTGIVPAGLTTIPPSTKHNQVVERYNTVVESLETARLALSLNFDPETKEREGLWGSAASEILPTLGFNDLGFNEMRNLFVNEVLEGKLGHKLTVDQRAAAEVRVGSLEKVGAQLPTLTKMGLEMAGTYWILGGATAVRAFTTNIGEVAAFNLTKMGLNAKASLNIGKYTGGVINESIGLTGSNIIGSNVFGSEKMPVIPFAMGSQFGHLGWNWASKITNKAIYNYGVKNVKFGKVLTFLDKYTSRYIAGVAKFGTKPLISASAIRAGETTSGLVEVFKGEKDFTELWSEITDVDSFWETYGAMLFMQGSRPDSYTRKAIENFQYDIDNIRRNQPEWNRLARNLGLKTKKEGGWKRNDVEAARQREIKKINDSKLPDAQKKAAIQDIDFTANRLKLKNALDKVNLEKGTEVGKNIYDKLQLTLKSLKAGNEMQANDIINIANAGIEGPKSAVLELQNANYTPEHANSLFKFTERVTSEAREVFPDTKSDGYKKYISNGLKDLHIEQQKNSLKESLNKGEISKAYYETKSEGFEKLQENISDKQKQLIYEGEGERKAMVAKHLEEAKKVVKSKEHVKSVGTEEFKKIKKELGGKATLPGYEDYAFQTVNKKGEAVLVFDVEAMGRGKKGATVKHEIWHPTMETIVGTDAIMKRSRELSKEKNISEDKAYKIAEKETLDFVEDFKSRLKEVGLFTRVEKEMKLRDAYDPKKPNIEVDKEFINEFIELYEAGEFNNVLEGVNTMYNNMEKTLNFREGKNIVDFFISGKGKEPGVTEALRERTTEYEKLISESKEYKVLDEYVKAKEKGLSGEKAMAKAEEIMNDAELVMSEKEIGENSKVIAEKNKRLDKLIIEEKVRNEEGELVPSEMIKEELVSNNIAKATQLAGKAANNPNYFGEGVSFNDWFQGYWLELKKIVDTYRPEKTKGDFGAYMMSSLHYRYGNILKGEMKGAPPKRVSLEAPEAAKLEAEEVTYKEPTRKEIREISPKELITKPELEKEFEDKIIEELEKIDKIEELDFSTLKDLAPEITAKMFDVPVKKISDPAANLTIPKYEKVKKGPKVDLKRNKTRSEQLNGEVFDIIKGGKVVGEIMGGKTKDGGFESMDVTLKPEFQGKGIGKSTYEKLANSVKGPLTSRGMFATKAGKGLWESLVRKGKAIKTPSGYEFLKGKEEIGKLKIEVDKSGARIQSEAEKINRELYKMSDKLFKLLPETNVFPEELKNTIDKLEKQFEASKNPALKKRISKLKERQRYYKQQQIGAETRKGSAIGLPTVLTKATTGLYRQTGVRTGGKTTQPQILALKPDLTLESFREAIGVTKPGTPMKYDRAIGQKLKGAAKFAGDLITNKIGRDYLEAKEVEQQIIQDIKAGGSRFMASSKRVADVYKKADIDPNFKKEITKEILRNEKIDERRIKQLHIQLNKDYDAAKQMQHNSAFKDILEQIEKFGTDLLAADVRKTIEEHEARASKDRNIELAKEFKTTYKAAENTFIEGEKNFKEMGITLNKKGVGVEYFESYESKILSDKHISKLKEAGEVLLKDLDLEILEKEVPEGHRALQYLKASLTANTTLKFNGSSRFPDGTKANPENVSGKNASTTKYIRDLLESPSLGTGTELATKKFIEKTRYTWQPGNWGGNKIKSAEITREIDYKNNKEEWTKRQQESYIHPELRKKVKSGEMTNKEALELTEKHNNNFKEFYFNQLLKMSPDAAFAIERGQVSASKGIPRGLTPMKLISTRLEVDPSQESMAELHNEHAKERTNESKEFFDIYADKKLGSRQKKLLIKKLVLEGQQFLIDKILQGIKDSPKFKGKTGRISESDFVNTVVLEGRSADLVWISGKNQGKTLLETYQRDLGKKFIIDYIDKIPESKKTVELIEAKQELKNEANNKKNQSWNTEVVKESGFKTPLNESSKKIRENISIRDKAVELAKRMDKPVKKIRVFDFDDTLAKTKSKVIYTMPNGKKGKLSAAEFAKRSTKLEAKGAKFDFSEFSKVVKGEKGPLFEVAKMIRESKGERDMFVLTARPAESAKAIHEFLKEIGLDIPIENIKGLGDGSPSAKANWMIKKAAEGYNDFYFADDHTGNIRAVKKVLSVLDVKSKVQQARINESSKKVLNKEFNQLIEQTTGIEHYKKFSRAKGKMLGAGKGKFKFFIPSSAEDFLGLLYPTLAKGAVGEKQLEWYNKHLLKPFARAAENLSTDRRNLMEDFRELKKQLEVPKDLKKKNETGFTNEQAARVYLWNKLGEKIPGLSNKALEELNAIVENNSKLKAFAEQMLTITKGDGYSKPGEHWLIGNMTTDLIDVLNITKRQKYLQEWQQNSDVIFSKENLNKLEAVYGKKHREALENMLARMKSGKNRTAGGNRLSNQVLDYINSSTGAIMFFNTRSAVLQTISAANYLNWGFNNPLRAGKAFANQPQYWKDFVELMNSDYLIDRRNGLKLNISESEIADAAKGSSNKAKAAINYILEKGYIPTKYADSFAIASGGATFYRNRIIDLMKKEGKSEAEAKEIAFREFREISEISQQSSRPDKISMQQASDLGRMTLQFVNTPMQYARMQKRAAQDLAAGRGDAKSHVSRIIYYAGVQNLLFNALQQSLFALGFGDEDEAKDEERIFNTANGMVDSVLRGIGFAGVTAQVLKNLGIDIYQRGKRPRPEYKDAWIKLLEFSPAIKYKLSKLKSAGWPFDSKKRRQEIFDKGWSLDNPAYESAAKVISATTNLPLERLYTKVNNIKEALADDTELWQSIAMVLGWSAWDIKPDEAKSDAHGYNEIQSYSKREQIDILKQHGYSDDEIGELSKEDDRVKAILESQEKSNEVFAPKIPTEEKEIERMKKSDEVYDLKKDEQIRILKSLGISDDEIKELKVEEDRVKKILSMRDEDSKKIDEAIKNQATYEPSEEEQKSQKVFDLNKGEQIKILEGYDLSKADIKALKYEQDRVDKILELQED